jgi:hypothetical protein
MVDATVPEESSHRIPTVPGHQLEDLLRAATVPRAPAEAAPSLVTMTLVVEAAAAGAPHTGLVGEPAAKAITEVEAKRTATSPVATMPATELKKYGSEAGDSDDFPALSARLRNLLLPEKFKPLGITKYDANQDPVQWLRCYALSIENTGGNNDTKCLYFPFYLDQAPLTWLESLDKNSIDEWDQLKAQFTSNFAGAMGRSGTGMDLAIVKQEQGETLRKYM